MRQGFKFAVAAFGLSLLLAGEAVAQSGGEASPGGAVSKPTVPDAPKNAKAAATAKPPAVAVAGNFGQWALVCGKEKC